MSDDPNFTSYNDRRYQAEPNIFTARDLYSLLAGAAIIDVGGTSDGAVQIKLSNGRSFVIGDSRKEGLVSVRGVRPWDLRFVTEDRGEWELPIPVVIRPKMQRRSGNGTLDGILALTGVTELFAIIYLYQNDRKHELYTALAEDPVRYPICGDVANELLAIGAASQGSWHLELIPKTMAAFQALALIACSVSERGRDLFWRRLEADTKVRESRAELAEIEVAQRRIKVKREIAVALREQAKTASTLLQFHKKHISTLPPNDPIRRRFETDLRGLWIDANVALLEDKPHPKSQNKDDVAPV